MVLLAVLAAAAAGPPMLLWHLTGNPLTHRPTLAGLHQAWTVQRISDTTLVTGLADAAWVCWALLALQVLAQTPAAVADALAYARTRDTVHGELIRPPSGGGRGPLGHPIRLLLTTILISLLAPRLPPTSMTPITPAPAASLHTLTPTHRDAQPLVLAAAHADGHSGAPHASASTTASHSTQTSTYVVREGDDLWQIAQRLLGDGERYHQILDLTRHHRQPDGRYLTDPNLIQPGWILTLPAHTTTPPPPTSADTGSTSHHGSSSTGGATGHAPPSTSPPTGRTITPGTSSRAGSVPGAARSASPSSTTSATPRTSTRPTPPPAATDSPSSSAHATTSPADRHGGVRLPGGGWLGVFAVGGLAAFAAAAALHRRRLARARWPIPLQRPEPPDPTVAAVTRARAIASAPPGHGYGTDHDDDPDDPYGPYQPAPDTDAADGAGAADGGGDDLERQALHARLAAAHTRSPELPPPAPASGLAGPARLPEADTLHAPGGLLLGEHPLFGLVPALDEALPGAGLTGHPDTVADAARALLLGALASGGPGASLEHIQVLATRDLLERLLPDHDQHQLAGLARLRIADGLPQALALAEAELLARRRAAELHEVHTAAELRAHHPDDAPDTLLLLAIPDDTHRRALAAILHVGAPLGIGAILLGPHPTAPTLALDQNGTVASARMPDGTPLPDWTGLHTHHLAPAEADALLTQLHTPLADDQSASPTPTPASTGAEIPRRTSAASARSTATQDTPDAPDAEAAAPAVPHGDDTPADTTTTSSPTGAPVTAPTTATSGDIAIVTGDAPDVDGAAGDELVRLCVLGPVRILVDRQQRDVTREHRALMRTLLAFLALHPAGVRREQVIEAIWPTAPPTRGPALLRSLLHQTRARLRDVAAATTGTVPEVEFIASDTATGRLILNPHVISTDLTAFTRFLRLANTLHDLDARAIALRQAVELYRGPLAEDLAADWLTTDREAHRRQAVDALTMLARIVGDTDGEQALALLDQALGIDPVNEELYQRIMRAQARLGRPDAVRRTFTLLSTRYSELGIDPATATLELLQSLTRPQRHSA